MTSVLTPASAGLLYALLGVIPVRIALVSWRNRSQPGAVPLVATGLGAGAASVVQGLRFVTRPLAVGETVSVPLHILLLAGINLAVLGTFYVAVEYTGQRELSRRWVVAVLAALGVVLPVARILSEAAGAGPAGSIADLDFLYRLVLAAAGLSLFARQLFLVRGVYWKQTGALLGGLAVGSGMGLVERYYTVAFVEFTLLGMTAGCVILGVALFRYEFLETAPVAREMLFDHVSDPVIALDDAGRVADLNRSACAVFGIPDSLVGMPAERVFQTDRVLESEFREGLAGRDAIGSVVADGRRHFDPDHPVISAIRSGESVDDCAAELAVLTGGQIEYFTVAGTELELAPGSTGQLIVFREITTERRRTKDLDVLKQVFSRVLRHNLRNEVTVIRGFASAIAERGDDETAANARRIVGRTDALVKTSETARSIKNVVDAPETVPISVPELVDRTLESAREDHPAVSYERSVADETVVANPEIDAALAELVENAIVHNDAENPRVAVTADPSGQRVELTVSDNGPGIPSYELDVLDQGGETSLLHGSGAGLWLVQTAVENSDGTVTYDTDDDDGTTVRVRLPAG